MLVRGASLMVIVKSILSGDSLILRGRAVNGPPPEKLVSLHGITAPRKDEPFYFESRDALRKLLVGQNVDFKSVLQSHGREFGHLHFDGQDVSSYMVQNGWATVKTDHELYDLQKLAKAQKLGIHSDNSPIVIATGIPQGSREFLDLNKNKEIPGKFTTNQKSNH